MQHIQRERDNEAVMDEKIYQAEVKAMEKGIEKGKVETSHAIALNFLNLGLSLETVSEATGLSICVLEELRNLTRTTS